MADVLIDDIFNNIVETIREPLLVLDSKLKVILASHSFYGIFKVKPEETVGKLIYDLGIIFMKIGGPHNVFIIPTVSFKQRSGVSTKVLKNCRRQAGCSAP